MNNDSIPGAILIVILATLAGLGIGFLVIKIATVQLPDRDWECTEATITEGKATCIKYEMRKGVKK